MGTGANFQASWRVKNTDWKVESVTLTILHVYIMEILLYKIYYDFFASKYVLVREEMRGCYMLHNKLLQTLCRNGSQV